ncbi:MAG: hypothetical protein FWF88_07025 [Peptococcaceae bacterium]|nr:hypothetical protein [Peptococcaceae bacterium]
MTRTQRVYDAIARRWTDKVPKGEWCLSAGLIAGILGCQGAIGWEQEAAARESLGMDLVVLGADQEDPSELDYEEFRRWRRETDFFIFALINGPFQGLARKMGWTDFFLMLGDRDDRDDRIGEMAARQSALSLASAKNALRNGAHAVLIADDVAQTEGFLVSYPLLRDIFVPLWRASVQTLKEEKVPVFFHSDGNVNGLLPDLIAAGFAGLHSLEPAAGMDIAYIKRQYGADLCLMGNIDLGFLVQAEAEEIAVKVKQLMDAAAPGGGYIFSTSCGCLGDEVPFANLITLYQCAEEYGIYPQSS